MDQFARETDGLVPQSTTPMLQPWEVYDRDLFDLEMVRVFGRSWVWLGDTEDLSRRVTTSPGGSVSSKCSSCGPPPARSRAS